MKREYRLSLVLLEPRELPEREPDYEIKWTLRRENDEMRAHAYLFARSPMEALNKALADVAQAFADLPLARVVSIACEEIG